MTPFRTTDQVRNDFALGRDGQITKRDDLLAHLFNDFEGDLSAAAAGLGPALFDVRGLKDGDSKWKDIRGILDPLLSQTARERIRRFETDLIAADTGGAADGSPDGFVTRTEATAFVKQNPDRWPNVALFLVKADAYVNRLPDYLAQPDLSNDPESVGLLWGILNHYAGEWKKSGTESAQWGTLYGLPLQGFPSTDRSNPPDLIRRATKGELSPEELSAVHRLLTIPKHGNAYDLAAAGSPAPLTTEEIVALDQLLQSADGAVWMGMRITSGKDDDRFFSERNRAVADFRSEMAAAKGNEAAVRKALDKFNATLARLESKHPSEVSGASILARAYLGTLTPTEVSALRVWMGERGTPACTGYVDCLVATAKRALPAIVRDLGPVIGASLLYRKLVLPRLFERQLTQFCGAPVDDPRRAFRDYQKFLKERMASGGFLKNLPRRALENPYVQLALLTGINLAAGGDHPVLNLAIDWFFMTDPFGTYDAWNTALIGEFAGRYSGTCRPSGSAETIAVPAPQNVAAGDPAVSLAEMFMVHPELNVLQPRSFISDFPQELQVAFMKDPKAAGEMTLLSWNLRGTNLEDALVRRYGRGEAQQAAQIRAEVRPLLETYRTQGATPGLFMALRAFILSRELQRIEVRTGEVAPQFVADELRFRQAVEAAEPGLAGYLAGLPERPDFSLRVARIAEAGKFPEKMTEADFGFFLNRVPGAASGAPVVYFPIPAGLEFAFSPTNLYFSEADFQTFQSVGSEDVAEALVRAYSKEEATAARIRADVPALLSPYARPDLPAMIMTRINGAKWALQWYVSQLASGGVPSEDAVNVAVRQAQTSGVVGSYFEIQESLGGFAVNHIPKTFDEVASSHWAGVRAHRAQQAADAAAAERGWSRAMAKDGKIPEGFQMWDSGELCYQGNPVYKDDDGKYYTIDIGKLKETSLGAIGADGAWNPASVPLLPMVVAPAIVPITVPSFNFSPAMRPAFI
ncbi:MAG TPA: hypothetical protein VLJ37_09710 [bacterium]|nr:hypothetical protein [bacterium]